uniref:THAP-type domain-containing protein n=1 Tax=Amphimedon queenslandica TaxID=400682 RepID=A0A1X7UAU0_AMPQE
MPNRCVAYGCQNTSSMDVSVFHFPNDSTLRKKWIQEVKRTRDRWNGPTCNSVICSEHFSVDSFEDPLYKSFGLKAKGRLKKDAGPTIFKRKLDQDLPQAKRLAYEKRD